jgi:Cyclic GMP-AMP synthase DncV-like, nucleotidyltransferase domain/Adenylyl/Guanylyl and SMODS C-terminal sensor domain
MGNASDLFFSTDTERVTLHRRITPSADQFDFQQEKWNDLADHLRTDVSGLSNCNVRTWLQGSYKFATQIRPARKGGEFDIDLGLFFEWEGEPEDGEFSPGELRDMVQTSLGRYEDDDVIEVVSPPKQRCCRIRYKQDFHIDIPVYHLDPERDARMLAAGNKWEDSDPKEFYEWFKEICGGDTRAVARRLIRYLKCWAGLKYNEDEKPSSTLITVFVAEAMEELDENDLAADDDALNTLLIALCDRLEADSEVRNPVNQDESLSDRLGAANMARFFADLVSFRGTASAALAETTEEAAADKWAQVFEHFFPLPDPAELLQKAALENRRLPVPVFRPEVHAHARLRGRPEVQYQGMNELGPIPKDCDITFTLANRNQLPRDAQVEWTVRNEGTEAENTNDLGHRRPDGLNVTEHSEYNGTHYMDCVVKQYGRIVGTRRIPVTIRDRAVPPRPPRNPKRRPAYTQIRGRR